MPDDAATSATVSVRNLLPALTMSVPIAVIFVGALSLALAAALDMGLTERQTAGLIVGLFGIPGVLSLLVTYVYRQPLLVVWNTGGVVFLATQIDQFTYAEITGAVLVSGLAVLAIGAFGFSRHLARWVPAPLVSGVIAGLVMPFVVRVFVEMADYPLIIGIMLAAFVLGHRYLGVHLPAILLVVLAGLAVAALSGEIQAPAVGWSLPEPALEAPALSLRAIVSISPVIAVLIAAQGNLPTVVYLRSQGYRPPERLIDLTTGACTAGGSVFGAVPICMASMLNPLTAGPEAGDHRLRHWSVYASAVLLLLIAALATMAAELPNIVPVALLMAIAGLALFGVLARSLGEITQGPLQLGPLFAFVITLSGVSLVGLGSVFWAIIGGLAVAMLLERERLQEIWSSATDSSQPGVEAGVSSARDQS
jgi:benzoate membrane transport protein